MTDITGQEQLAIDRLVEARRRELQITRAELVLRAGFKNAAKGIRRLCALFDGDFETTGFLLAGLPVALEIPSELVAQAVTESRQQIAAYERAIAEKADAEWRANFRPHACILTQRIVPQPIFIAALCRTDWHLYVQFDPKGGEESYASTALAAVRARIAEGGGVFMGFGPAVGFVVNYTPDFAVRFDLNGTPKELLGSAYRLGRATLALSGGRLIRPSLSIFCSG